ncbi:MAG: hypothetical protein WAX44_02695 [Minisyncoccia bacterium]
MNTPDLIFPSFSFSNLTFLFGRPMLIAVLAVFFIFYVVYSSVLIYHWSTYGMKSREVVFAESLFYLVSVALFAVAGLSIFLY